MTDKRGCLPLKYILDDIVKGDPGGSCAFEGITLIFFRDINNRHLGAKQGEGDRFFTRGAKEISYLFSFTSPKNLK
jgi:hypothetical protein